jgi:hypothetical protein
LNENGTGALYSALFGGSKGDYVTGIDIDYFGNAYLCGYTESYDYPTTPEALQETFRGIGAEYQINGFITKLNSDGSALVYSTFLSGFKGPFKTGYYERTGIRDIVINNREEVFVTGNTEGLALPVTADAFQKELQKWDDAFLVRLSSDGKSLVYSTYLGGDEADVGRALALNNNGDVVIAGYTNSRNFPVTAGAVDDSLYWTSPQLDYDKDAFITKFHFPGGFSSIESNQSKPLRFRITGLYPNPFNSSTTIIFCIPQSGDIILSVYSITGQKVREVFVPFLEGGSKQIHIDGKDSLGKQLASGVYAIRVEFGKYSDVRKVLIMR